jgi:GNAT superfamily N-acetyltransferase
LNYYHRVRDFDDCKNILVHHGPFNASFEVDLTRWGGAPDGKISIPENDETLSAAHNVLFVGYDDDTQELRFINSWGPEWGDNGYGYMPYEYYRRFLLEAWVIPKGGRPGAERPAREGAQSSGLHLLEWGVPDALGGQLHGVEIDDLTYDDHQAWAFAVVRNGYLDIEELFVRPEWRARGHGPKLIQVMQQRAAKLDLPLRIWVPHVDGAESTTLPTFCRLIRRLGLRIDECKQQWASYVVTEQ